MTSQEKLQKQLEYRYRQKDPEITIAHDHINKTKDKVKIPGVTLKSSELYDYIKNSTKDGYYISLNNPLKNEDDSITLHSQKNAQKYYTVFIDIDNSEINPFIGCPLKPSFVAMCTNGVGWHAEFFIDPIDFNPENKKRFQKVFDIVKSWFELKGFKADNTKDVGRYCRIPYSPHNKPGKESFYYKIEKVRKLYYSLEEIESVFMSHINAESVYTYCTRYDKVYAAGERHNMIFNKAVKFYANGIPQDQLIEYVFKFSGEYCEPPHTESDRQEIETQCERAISYINDQGGPTNIMEKIEDTPIFDLDQGGFIKRLKYYLSEGEIIYNINNKSWYRFKDKYWVDNRMPLYSLITEIVDTKLVEEKEIALLKLNKELTEKKVDFETRKKQVAELEKRYNMEIKTAHTTYYKDAVMKQLAEQDGFAATEELKALDLPVFNQVHHKFNFANGSFNFDTMQLENHNWQDYSTVMTPYVYEPGAKSPKFEAFLYRILDQGVEERTESLIEWMQVFLGSCLIGGDNKNKVFPVWYGSGDNGKSTFVDIISQVFNEYSGSIRAEAITSKADNNRFEMSDVPNKRFLIANESKEGAFLNVSLVKAMTGNDVLKCERKGAGQFDFKPSFKIILLTNNKPTITEKTEAIWERVKLVPFLQTITKEEKNPNIKEEIMEESSGVVNWLVEGAKKWIENGYNLPDAESITEATQEYRVDENFMQNWIDDSCEVVDSPYSGDTVTTLYKAFTEDTGSKLGRKNFGKELEKMGFIKEKIGSFKFNLRLLDTSEKENDIDIEPYGDEDTDFSKVSF